MPVLTRCVGTKYFGGKILCSYTWSVFIGKKAGEKR